MRLRLSVGKIPQSGYINIDPIPKGDTVSGLTVRPLDFRTMEFFDVSKKSECTEILLDDVLEYVGSHQLEEFLSYICAKLRKYGKIHLKGLDITEITRMRYNDELSENEMNLLLFGPQDTPWGFKNGCHSARKIKQILEGLGLKITSIKLDNGKYCISGERL